MAGHLTVNQIIKVRFFVAIILSIKNRLVGLKKSEYKVIFRKALEFCPQKKAKCDKAMCIKPKKPNSSRRPIAKCILSTKRKIIIHVPGIGTNILRKHAVVLINGSRPIDLPGVKYRAVRGSLDLKGVKNRVNARSRYGVKLIGKKNIKFKRKN